MKQYNKLIRDKIPERLEKQNIKYKMHVASEEEYKEKLHKKLQEEVNEFLEEPNKEELSDILEVIYALCDHHNITREELEMARKEKAEKRGEFKEKLILEHTE